MYINFKSKHAKIIWLLLGFLISCFLVHKVEAAPSFSTYDFNNYSFSYGGLTLNKESFFQMVNEQLSLHNKSLDDYQYITFSIPTNPTSQAGQRNGDFRIFLQNVLPISCTNSNRYSIWNCDYDSADLPIEYFSIIYNFNTKQYTSGVYSFNSRQYSVPWLYSGDSSSATMNVYTNYDFTPIFNKSSYNLYTKFYHDPQMLSTLPTYLQGYKKITLTSSDKYIMLSGLSSGSVYIPTSDFDEYGGRLSYYDNDLSTQPYTSYIQDYTKMPDGNFIRQDFNLENYTGADWVMFSKYIYLEGEDNIAYDIYVPSDIYDSDVIITPNSQGGNDFDFTYKDSNGDILSGIVQSEDLSQESPLLGNIFSDFSSNTFGLTSIITAPLSLISSVSSASCTPLTLPLPFVGGSLTLPCMYSFYSSTFGVLFTLYQTITFGIVAYWVIVRIFNMVKDFKNPDHDEIEVVDL